MQPASDPRAKARRPWTWRIVITLLAVVAAGTVGAAGVAFFAYDQATRIDRSQPDLVVSDYLRAFLVARDDASAQLYVCGEAAGLKEMRAWRDQEVTGREQDLGVAIGISWGVLTVTDRTDRTATVTTDLRRSATVDGIPQSVLSTWRFQVVRDDGWRVCGATKTG
jgi:hypothetical protein